MWGKLVFFNAKQINRVLIMVTVIINRLHHSKLRHYLNNYKSSKAFAICSFYLWVDKAWKGTEWQINWTKMRHLKHSVIAVLWLCKQEPPLREQEEWKDSFLRQLSRVTGFRWIAFLHQDFLQKKWIGIFKKLIE